jgi:exopolysaccharide biosynthesis polyprenyl glycosylphosphotransferase
MLRRFSTNFVLFSALIDGMSVFAALKLMARLRIVMNQLPFIAYIPAPVLYPLWMDVVFPLVWITVLAAFSIYDAKKNFKLADELAALTTAAFIAAISQAGILYLTFRDFSRALFLLVIVSSYLLCVLWRLVFRLIFRVRKDTLNFSQQVMVLGLTPEIQTIKEKLLHSPPENFEGITVIDLKAQPDFTQESPENCPKTSSFVRKEVQRVGATDVIIAFPRCESGWIEAIASNLEDLPLGVWIALDYYDLSIGNTYVENLAGLSLVGLRAPALDDYARVIKRGFDLILSLLALILFSPLFIFAGLMVLFDSGRPVFFKQKRVGENGCIFTMIKFRTMIKEAEELRAQVEKIDENGNLIHKTKDDPRITRAGRFLRRFSLDELPQLINVVRGEMSLVGPRPELPYLAEKYDHWQRKRLSVPPGITGWWQIKGRSDRLMHLHTEDDIYYVEHYSIWLDLRILIRTIWVVIMGNGAY